METGERKTPSGGGVLEIGTSYGGFVSSANRGIAMHMVDIKIDLINECCFISSVFKLLANDSFSVFALQIY